MTELRTIVCGHIHRGERDVRLAVRHWDGEWQLVCGEQDHPPDCADFEVVGFEHLLERQPSLSGVVSLEPGSLAEWCDGGWKTNELPQDED